MGAEQLGVLGGRGLVAGTALTDDGRATAKRLIGARCEALHALVADWQPDNDPRVNDVIDRLARELARDVPALSR